MNKMADVAKLLGVELGEEFIAKYPKWKKVRCKILEHCFNTSATDGKLWNTDTVVLYDLIKGNCKVYKLPWKAELNEEYYIPYPISNLKYHLIINNGSKQDDIWYKDGLMCKTQEQAIETAKAMIKVACEMQRFDDEEDEE